MGTDSRANSAEYFDLQPSNPDDVGFYRDRLPSSDATVLELGCGTGRVLVPLAASCRLIHGLDNSQAMLSICRRKIDEAGIGSDKARAEYSDITDFDLGKKFDLITAPYSVFQSLDIETQISGVFDCIRNHVLPDGTCILTAFNPNRGREEMLQTWASQGEVLNWDVPIDGGNLTQHSRTPQFDEENLVVYPELIYRRYQNEELVDETVLLAAMKVYYPSEFTNLIEIHGFRIVNQWGGYAGELYGEGPELIVQFAL